MEFKSNTGIKRVGSNSSCPPLLLKGVNMSDKSFIIANILLLIIAIMCVFILVNGVKKIINEVFTEENAKILIIDIKKIGNYIDTVNIENK